MLDGLGSLNDRFLLLLGSERGKEVGGVVEEEAFGPGDEVATVEAVALALHGAYNFTTVEAIIDKLVFLRHAGTLGPLQVYFLGPWLLFLIFLHVKEFFRIAGANDSLIALI